VKKIIKWVKNVFIPVSLLSDGCVFPLNVLGYWKLDEGSIKAFDSVSINNGTITGAITRGVTLAGEGHINIGDITTFNVSQLTLSAWFKTTAIGYMCVVSKINSSLGAGYSMTTEGSKIRVRVGDNVTHTAQVDSTTSINTGDWVHCVLTSDGINIKLYINGIQEGGDQPFGYNIGYSSGENSIFRIGARGNIPSQYFIGDIDEVGIWGRPLSIEEILILHNNGVPLTFCNNYSVTPTPSISLSITPTLTVSNTPTVTPTLTMSITRTPTLTPSITPSKTPTVTPSITPSKTPSLTPSISTSITPTPSISKIPNITPSKTPTVTPIVSNSLLNGIVSYWKLNETGSTSNAIDETGLTDLNLSAGGVLQNVAGKIGACYIFNATSSGMLGNVDDTYEIAGSMSISCWIKTTTNDNNGISIAGNYKSSNPGRAWDLIIINQYVYFDCRNGVDTLVSGSVNSTSSVITGNWVHIVGVLDSTVGLKLYINGIEEDNVSWPYTNLYGDTNRFQIGARANELFFNGCIDEFGIWNKALSPTEVSLLYNSGNGKTYPFGLNVTPSPTPTKTISRTPSITPTKSKTCDFGITINIQNN
jgi:hypothetical protein